MQEQRPDVHATLLHRIGQQRRQRIDYQRDSTQNDHRPTCHLRRINHAHSALVDQIDPDKNERGVVDQSGNDFDPAIAKGHPRICRTPGDFAGDKSDDQ